MGNALRALDYLFVIRPTLFFAVWTGFLCGHLAAVRFAVHDGATCGPIFWLLAAAVSLGMGSVFIVNQLKDISTDRENDKLYLIAKGEVPTSHARLEAAILATAALGSAALVGLTPVVVIALLLGVGGVAYSFEPFLWKNRPILGMLVNTIGALLIFSIGWLTAGELDPSALRYGLPYALAVTGTYLLTTIPDEPGDRVAGKVTFVIRFGTQRTTQWAAVAVAGAALGGLVNRDVVIGIAALASFPLFLLAAIQNRMPAILRAIKFSVFFLAMMVCWFRPLYLAVLVVVFFASKFYYRARFGLNYPSFRT